jgi:hypothetical protein
MLGGPDGRTLFQLTAHWPGFEHVHEPHTTGRIVTSAVEVPHAGYPRATPDAG